MRPEDPYNQNYALFADLGFIEILLSTVLINNWDTIQIDYMIAFHREPVYRESYMNITKVIEVQRDTEWVRNVKKNIHGNCQSGIVWNKLLV